MSIFSKHAKMEDVPGTPEIQDALLAIQAAAVGGHNVLLIGPPAPERTMVARRLPGIMPPLDTEDAKILYDTYKRSNLLTEDVVREEVALFTASRLIVRPFRAPHHSISAGALNGYAKRPGESALAHAGVLFLDCIEEFMKRAIEHLRTTMHCGHTSDGTPARFLLVASATPCPCGWLGFPARSCVCNPEAVERHWHRISSVLDLFEIRTWTPLPKRSRDAPAAEDTVLVQERVQRARIERPFVEEHDHESPLFRVAATIHALRGGPGHQVTKEDVSDATRLYVDLPHRRKETTVNKSTPTEES